MTKKLGVKLVLCALLSLLIAGGTFAAVSVGGTRIIEKKLYTHESIISKEKELFREFIAYVNQNSSGNLATTDSMEGFFKGRKNLIIAVYNAGQRFEGSQATTLLYSSINDPASLYEVLQSEYQDYWYTCPVSVNGDFARTKIVRVMYFPMYTAARALKYAAGAGAFIVFACSLLLLVSRKTRYISNLSTQLNAMAGGELDVPISVKGNDEVGLLARNMEFMRQSFIERLKTEEGLKKAQSELIRDMSHDLRTPLTALTGYLELLDRNLDANPAKGYAQSALRRARQIKEMTDELFEYILVYGEQEGLNDPQKLDAAMCLSQLWEEEAAELETAGFVTQTAPTEGEMTLDIDVRLIRRVLDNICSNITKYADKTFPVVQKTVITDKELVFEVVNHISENPVNTNSSGIGLKSCKKIMALHKGDFQAEEKEGLFITRLVFNKSE